MQITICGGGNAAHTLAGLLSARPEVQVNIFAPLDEEARRWQKGIAAGGGIEVHFQGSLKIGQPHGVNADPAQVVPGSDLVLLALPAFAHETILKNVLPYLSQGAWIGALPARGGFDWCISDLLASGTQLSNGYTVFGLQTLPWACRVEEFGRIVRVMGVKDQVDVAVNPPQQAGEVLAALQALLGIPLLPADNFLVLTLSNTGQIIHPGLMFALFHEWDGELYERAPLFYKGAGPAAIDLLLQLSDEIQALRRTLEANLPGVDFSSIRPIDEWMRRAYASEIAEASSLQSCLVTNRSYAGLTAPMRRVGGGLVPDFTTRYLAEDIPYGLVVTRGIAELVGTATPVMDKVITWAQARLEREYLVAGKLQGRDLQATRAPQRYGITKINELVSEGDKRDEYSEGSLGG